MRMKDGKGMNSYALTEKGCRIYITDESTALYYTWGMVRLNLYSLVPWNLYKTLYIEEYSASFCACFIGVFTNISRWLKILLIFWCFSVAQHFQLPLDRVGNPSNRTYAVLNLLPTRKVGELKVALAYLGLTANAECLVNDLGRTDTTDSPTVNPLNALAVKTQNLSLGMSKTSISKMHAFFVMLS